MAEKITDDELEAIAREFIANALGGPGSEVSAIRERNLRAYNALPEGEFAPVDIDDRSQYVATDVADTVDGMIPQILDVFVSDDKAIECKATKPGPDSEAIAKTVTGYLNYLFYTKNEGLNVLYDWVQDAMLQKVAHVKVWAEEEKHDDKQTYEGQSEDALAAILQDGAELEGEPTVDEQGALNFTVVNNQSRMCIKVESVAPHQMRVDKNARWGTPPSAIGEVREKRRYELEQMGYDLEDVGGDYAISTDGIGSALLGDSRDETDSSNLHDSHKLYEYAELYFQLDVDGDGTAEWVQVCLINGHLMRSEQTDGDPYVDLCLMPRSHAYMGDCPADRAFPIQKEQTNLMRSLFDNVQFATNQRTYVNTEASVNINDLLDNRPGGMVRGKGRPADAFAPIPTMPIPQTAWQLQEAMAVLLEQRTGFTRYSQGMDADSLNKTATGVKLITAKSDMRTKLMTRFVAQSLKKLFGKMLKLATKHQDKREWFEVNGEWHEVLPTEWRDQFNIKPNVGLGHGTQEQQGQAIMAMVPLQQMGQQMGVVTPKHVAHTIRTFATSQGFKNPDDFADAEPTGLPNPEQFQQLQQQVQEQQQQAQQQMQQMGQELQQLGQENQALKQQAASKDGELQLKAAELELKHQEFQHKAQESEAQYGLQVQAASAPQGEEGVAEQVAEQGQAIEQLAEAVQNLGLLIQGALSQMGPKRMVINRGPDGEIAGGEVL
ncbi:MAG: hypothetical protein M3R04_09100 [bacterium]|nr:hypothetical protein [bacterium]